MSEQDQDTSSSPDITAGENEEQPMFFHVFVHEGSKAKEVRNLSFAHIMERYAVPYKLNKRFRVDGFEFTPSRITRLKITKSSRRHEPSRVMERIDVSSIASFFASAVKASQEDLEDQEDVTDPVLAYADELIREKQLVPEGGGVFDRAVQDDKVFLIMSFAPELSDNYDALREVCKDWNVRLIRVDKEMKSSSVVDRILAHLKEANYVIADLTGARPNVYYEIGYFDAVCEARKVDSGEKMLLVAQNVSDAHFDLRHRGIREYKNPYELMKIVRKWLTEVAGAVSQS
jgi:hypothetical protein